MHPAKRNLHLALAAINPPFSDKRSIRVEEKIYILSQIAGNWILEVSDFFGIGLLAMAVVVDRLKLSDVPGTISHGQFTKLLSMEEVKLGSYADKKGWPLADKRRLVRRSRWSRSVERTVIEDFFLGLREQSSRIQATFINR